MKLNFEWDEGKAKANLKKHRGGFEEVTTVFLDPFSMTIPDPDHSEGWGNNDIFDIGSSDKRQMLVVVYTERGSNIRIISCRMATSSERDLYEKESTDEGGQYAC